MTLYMFLKTGKSLSFNWDEWPRNQASNLGRGENLLKRVPISSDTHRDP